MDAERWQKLKNILENALETAPESRSAYLDQTCGTDDDLRREVEKLLEFEQTDEDILEQNPISAVLQNDFFSKDQIGRQIGNYKIIGELGAGGMGAVFLAERADGEFSQKVAVKLIKRGMDSDAVLRRFFNERQILASLEHPNIAHLLDGGTTDDNLPFFVMEYVEGANILDYADVNDLDLTERLKLFREICAAVSFAHQNLVIHRDLKPSNILITNDGKVKLLDFGIAKLLNSDAKNQTATQMQIFTPEYASPEQIKGEKLTTATDVYSLGVILYELLTGTRPHKTDSKNISEIIKSVCETEPKPPSAAIWDSGFRNSDLSDLKETVSANKKTDRNTPQTNPKSQILNPKSLRGDLDNIILKSLRKEPERRYSSVEQFSEDIHRHLNGLPVSASADTWSYHAAKFIRRNRLAVGVAALFLVTLLGGLAATLWQNRIARQERMRAERRSENLRKVSNSLVSEIERAIRDLPGSLPARKLLLDRAIEQLDALALESDGDTKLQLELVWAYQNLANLPDRKVSDRKPILEKAVALTENIIAAEPSNLAARDRLAMLYLDMIYNSRLRGDVDFTLEYNRRAVQIVDEILRESPDQIEYQDSFWTANYHYALTMQQLGQADETVETARKILPVAEKMYQTNADGYDYMKPHLTRMAIGYGLSYKGDYQSAVAELENALAECRNELKKKPEADILRRNEANIRTHLAVALENLGDAQTALTNAEIALEIRTKLAAANPSDFDYALAKGEGEFIYAQMLWRQTRNAALLEQFQRINASAEKLIELDSERIHPRILLARSRSLIGSILVESGKIDEGLQNLNESAFFFESVGAAISADAHLKRYLAETRAQIGDALLKKPNASAQEIAEAQKNYRQSLEVWQDLQRQGILRHAEIAQLEAVTAKINTNN